MQTMNIALPKPLKDYVQDRTEQGGYSSVSEYIRELIRRDQQQSAQAMLEAELLKGLASGPAKKMSAAEWAGIRAEVKRRVSRKSR